MAEEEKVKLVKISGIVDSHSARRLAPVVPDPGMIDPDDIVTFVRKNKVTKIGEGEDDYIVEEVVVENSRVNRKAFIEKDAPDVGVLNVLEKVRRSGDVTLLDQIGYRCVEPSGEVDALGRPLGKIEDYTNVPSNVGDVLKAVQQGSLSYDQLKPIFGDISFDSLAKMSAEEIGQAVLAYTQKVSSKDTEGEK